MNKIAEQLRQTAALLAANQEGFVCHELSRVAPDDQGLWLNCPGEDIALRYAALRFLKALGMPLDGGGFQCWGCHDEGTRAEDGEAVPYATRLELRVTWCEFAACLAEEWNVTAANVHQFEEPKA